MPIPSGMALSGGDLRRDAIMAFIADFWATHEYGPSMREIATGVGLNQASSAAYQVRILLEAGCLRHVEGIARTIRVVEE